tara:strand:- start:246 stop:1025 length:780 start_codon:yes stop_codon:yes gene_type:complete
MIKHNFWIFGDSFGVPNDITSYYHNLKKSYPNLPDKQDIVGSEWVQYVAKALGYQYDLVFNMSKHGTSADGYMMRLFRMIQKEAIRPGDFVLITATAETRFQYSDDIEGKFDWNDPYKNGHLKHFHSLGAQQWIGQKDSVLTTAPDCLYTYMNKYQDYTWLAYAHWMKHEFIKGYLDSLNIDSFIVQGIACRQDTLPENKLGWGKQPNPLLLIQESIKEYKIKEDEQFHMYQIFTNHLDPKQNKIYADQIIEYYNEHKP